MKFKYLLASGLFLSTAFVACTNDEFAEISAPVANTEDAIALGEGFTINVNKGGVDTRAAFDNKYTPYWEKEDKLGAAWVNMVTDCEQDENGVWKVTADGVPASNLSGMQFYSNHPFVLTSGENTNSGEFESVTNAFAGAYVLYYPYDETVAMTGDKIPVGIKTYEADCANPLKNISENMFSYSPAAFIPGGPRTGQFNLKQVPVLVRLQFAISEKANFTLTEPITIQNIVLEANDGASVVVKEGKLTATASGLTADNYNGANNKNLDGIVKYEKVENANNIFVTLKNSNSSKFQMLKEDQPTQGEFVFSMLPLEKAAKKLVVKVVTDKGVFSTTYDPSVGTPEKQKYAKERLNLFNEGKKDGKANIAGGENGGAAYKGGQVAMGITLDVTENDKVIYTVSEFEKRWEAALKSGKAETLEIGTPLELTKALTCNNANAEVTIKGQALTVPSVNFEQTGTGKGITFECPLIVEGELKTSGDAELAAEDLTAKTVNIQGDATLKVRSVEEMTVATSGVVTVEGLKDKKGKNAEIAKVINRGTLKPITTNLDIKSLDSSIGSLSLENDITNKGDMVLGETTIAVGYQLYNEGTLTLQGVFKGSLTNRAGATLEIVNANEDPTTNVLTMNSTLALTNEGKTTEKAAGTVTIGENVVVNAGNSNGVVTNKGIINVNGTLAETGNSMLVQSAADADARINVAADASITTASTTGVVGGYIILDAEVKNVSKGDCAVYAANVTAAATDEQIKDEADTWFMNGSFTSAQIVAKTGYDAKDLIFTGGTITFDGTNNVIMATGGNVTFDGAVVLAVSAGKTGEFTFDGTENKVTEDGSLTVNEGVTLKGTASAELSVEKGAGWKNSGTVDSSLTVNI